MATKLAHYVAQQKPADARTAADHSLTPKATGFQPTLESAVADAQVQAAMGKPSEAVKKLNSAVTKATKLNFLGYELMARLRINAIEPKGGQISIVQTEIASLEKDAKNKNYFLIARKAGELNHASSTH